MDAVGSKSENQREKKASEYSSHSNYKKMCGFYLNKKHLKKRMCVHRV